MQAMFELGNPERHVIFQLDHRAIFQLGKRKSTSQ